MCKTRNAVSVDRLILFLSFAVYAAVDAVFPIDTAEHVFDLLLAGGDATGVFAFDHVYELLGHLDGFLFGQFAEIIDLQQCGRHHNQL